MSPLFYLCCVLSVVCAVCLFRLFKKDVSWFDSFKEKCLRASLAYAAVGFVTIPRLLQDLALCNVRQLIKDFMSAMWHLFVDGSAQEEATKIFEAQLAASLKDSTKAQAILAKAQQAVKSLAPSIVLP